MNVQEAVNRARAAVERRYGEDPRRAWQTAWVDSYAQPDYRIELHVWAGSPAKGWVIVNHGTQVVIAYDGSGRRIKAWSYQA